MLCGGKCDGVGHVNKSILLTRIVGKSLWLSPESY